MKELIDLVKRLDEKTDSIMSLLNALVIKYEIVNDEDDEELLAKEPAEAVKV